jgi:Protein of unknown function (DUF3168)
MTLVEGLVAFLSATEEVTVLLGGTVPTPIYPNESPPNAPTPRITVKRTAEKDDYTLDKGASKSPTATVTIECWGGRWGKGYTAARTLADAVLDADGGLGGLTLESYRGKLGTVVCQSCRFTGDADEDESPVDGSGRGQESVNLEFSVAYLKQS